MLKVNEKSLEDIVFAPPLKAIEHLKKYRNKELAEVIIWEGEEDLIDFVFDDGSFCTVNFEVSDLEELAAAIKLSIGLWYHIDEPDLNKFNIKKKSWLWTPENSWEEFK